MNTSLQHKLQTLIACLGIGFGVAFIAFQVAALSAGTCPYGSPLCPCGAACECGPGCECGQ